MMVDALDSDIDVGMTVVLIAVEALVLLNYRRKH